MAPSAVAMAKNNPKASGKTAPRTVHQAEPCCGVCEGDHSPGLPHLGGSQTPPAGPAVSTMAGFEGSDAPPQLSLGEPPAAWAGAAGAGQGAARGPSDTKGSGPGAWSHLLYPEASTDLDMGS